MAASGLLPASGRVLVALSGGPDSTALLLATRELGLPVVAAHFDHDLRSGSDRDAAQTVGLCQRLGVPLIAGRRSRPLPAGSIQAAARRLRYEFLEQSAADAGVDAVAFGHTADDLVEGVLLHLLRGSGLAGMRGMPDRRGLFVRPMLGLWRTDVIAYLSGSGVTAVSDPSNADLRHRRVWVRLRLLPQLERDRPGITLRLHSAAAVAASLQARLEAAAEALLEGDVEKLRAEAAPVRAEAYRAMFERAGGVMPGLSRRHLQAIERLVTRGRAGDSAHLPLRLRARLLYGRLEIAGLEPSSDPGRYRLSMLPCTPSCDQAGTAHVRAGLDLSIGFRRPGLRLRPHRHGGTRKLQDLLVDARLPRHQRDSLPLAFAGGRLAWVPGIAVEAGFAPSAGEPEFHLKLEGVPGDA